MNWDDFPLTLQGVTLKIERLRADAGHDAAKLTALSLEFERHLRAAAPHDLLLADYAQKVLDGYCNMARHGLFPEVFEEEDL